jgi:hypothetical protein
MNLSLYVSMYSPMKPRGTMSREYRVNLLEGAYKTLNLTFIWSKIGNDKMEIRLDMVAACDTDVIVVLVQRFRFKGKKIQPLYKFSAVFYSGLCRDSDITRMDDIVVSSIALYISLAVIRLFTQRVYLVKRSPQPPTLSTMSDNTPNFTNPPTSSSVFIVRRFDRDGIVPKVGEVIKLRFPATIAGPGSALSASALTTLSNGRQNQHSALVLSTTFDMRPGSASLLITAYPMPAYSNTKHDCPEFENAEEWLLAQPAWKQNRHVPVPPATAPSAFPRRLSPTYIGPSGQREPWADRIPCWVALTPVLVSLPMTRTWKAYKLDVMFPGTDVALLRQYEATLPPIPAIPTTINCYYEPDPPLEVQALYRSLGQDYCGGEIIECGGRSDDESDDNEEENYTPLQVSRLFAPWVPWMAAEVQEHDRREAEDKNKRTLSWIERLIHR